jgi:hypothetical protein
MMMGKYLMKLRKDSTSSIVECSLVVVHIIIYLPHIRPITRISTFVIADPLRSAGGGPFD